MATRKSIAITGAAGFVGKNLALRLGELDRFEVLPLFRSSSHAEWRDILTQADAVVHLAGVNRPQDPAEFVSGNRGSAEKLISALEASGRTIPILYASSSKAAEPSPYGESKRLAEDVLLAFSERAGAPVAIYRLPNIFGKWCRPNYNSAVATFCHHIARGEPITIHDPAACLDLVYIDDVVDAFIAMLDEPPSATGFYEVEPVYQSTVGKVAEIIRSFRVDRDENLIADVGNGFTRALYSTYVSYLPVSDFSYPIPCYRDPRGAFSEMLKTRNAGQFSYFTALPGVTRGGHYHHSKTEKFLIVHGEALFRFRHMLTGEMHEVRTSAEEPVVVETIPGWAHDVSNIGEDIMVSLLWANEIFDRDHPDTIAAQV